MHEEETYTCKDCLGEGAPYPEGRCPLCAPRFRRAIEQLKTVSEAQGVKVVDFGPVVVVAGATLGLCPSWCDNEHSVECSRREN